MPLPDGSPAAPDIKDPDDDRKLVTVSYEPWCTPGGYTITSATATASGVTIDSAVTVETPLVGVYVIDGVVGTAAYVTFKATRSDGAIKALTSHLRIVESENQS